MLADRKKILIVSASVGAGHTQAARALEAAILRSYPESTISIVDFMAGENSYLNTFFKGTYLKLIDLTPNIYDRLYRWTQNSRQVTKMTNLFARAMKRSMLRLYRQYRPEMIICTHPFPCGAAAYLRRHHLIQVPLGGVITDYAIHQMWVYSEVDLYFVAAAELEQEMLKRGIQSGRVFATGIPIDRSFSQPIEISKINGDLELIPGLPTVLVMGGGIGKGPIQEVFRSLDGSETQLQIVVVAGKNQLLQRELDQLAEFSRHRVVVLGFTTRVRELMAVANLLITKPGALTISEALAVSLPMVLFSPIPGQEEDNADFLVKKGAAVLAEHIDTLGRAVTELLSQPEKLESMRQNASQLGQPKAADQAVAIIGRHLDVKHSLAAGV